MVDRSDGAFWEHQLNPRVASPDGFAAASAEWPERAAATRASHPHRLDIPYGAHPRQCFDVFPAAEARGTLVFFHGGYWRALSRDLFHWVADGFVDRGITVVLVGYPLCPEVTLAAIVDSCRAGFAAIAGRHLSAAERARVAVAGHSAGGYLTAAMLATDWRAHGLPARPIAGAVSISGVFDLLPLTRTSINDQLRLSEADAMALSLTGGRPIEPVPLGLAYGGAEPEEFHRQSRALAEAWTEFPTDLAEIPGADHFDILQGLRRPGSRLHAMVMRALG